MDYEEPSLDMKRFATGFVIGLTAFAVANVVSPYYFYRPLHWGIYSYRHYGFPFVVWTESGIPVPMNVIALCCDIAIAVMVSAAVGWFWGRRDARGRRKV
jgi:hypothetical protein